MGARGGVFALLDAYDPMKWPNPWSFRPEASFQVRIHAYMDREGIGKTEAIHKLVHMALDAEGIPRTNGDAKPKTSRWSLP